MEFYASATKSKSGSKSRGCVFCGSNPVNSHFLYWYFQSSNIFLASIRRFVLCNSIAAGLKKQLERLAVPPIFLVKLGLFFRVLRLQGNLDKCTAPRAKVLWAEAEKRQIEIQELLLFNRPFDVYIARKKEFPKPMVSLSNGKSSSYSTKASAVERIPNSKPQDIKTIVFSGLPRPTGYDDRVLDWLDDKWLFKKKLAQYGLPVPQGGSVWNFRQAKTIFDDIQGPASRIKDKELGISPVIVKPRSGSRGRHSTTFVSSIKDLKEAFKIAKQLCFWVMIEEQLKGPVYRATVINYQLHGVLRGDPPQVIGDGTHTIRELITIKNQQLHPGVRTIVADEQMERFVARQIPDKPPISDSQFPKSALDSIPAPGSIIFLSEKIGVNYGGSSSEDFDICHPDNRELFVSAAKIVGDPIVGFDFIIPDITKSWREQRCGFIEANSLPFINLHHNPLHGQSRNVAAEVWEMIGW